MLSSLTFHHYFTCISGYRTLIEVILIGWKAYSKIYNSYFYLRGQIPTILTTTKLKSGQKKKFDSAQRKALRYSGLPQRKKSQSFMLHYSALPFHANELILGAALQRDPLRYSATAIAADDGLEPIFKERNPWTINSNTSYQKLISRHFPHFPRQKISSREIEDEDSRVPEQKHHHGEIQQFENSLSLASTLYGLCFFYFFIFFHLVIFFSLVMN